VFAAVSPVTITVYEPPAFKLLSVIAVQLAVVKVCTLLSDKSRVQPADTTFSAA
jgi:hypothetical protein